MFITTVHLLTPRNLLRELQTSIHIILAHKRHNSLAFSTLGLKCKKKAFTRVGVKVWNEMPNEYKNLSKKSFKKRNKKSSSQYSRNWRFLYGAWWDNAKIQTQQNWIKLNQFYNIFRTLRNARIFFSFTMNICHFPFFCVSFCPVMLYFFIFVLFPV